MSETTDRLRQLWACECGADGRVKQWYLEARQVAQSRSASFLDLLWPGGGQSPLCEKCDKGPWCLQPAAPFTLTGQFDERLLACKCGGGGERAKQDYQAARANYAGPKAIPLHWPTCNDCGAWCWGIVPGVEAVVPCTMIYAPMLVQHGCPDCRCGRAAQPIGPLVRRRLLTETDE